MNKKEQAKKMFESGCKYKEIAEKINISQNTLKSWKSRESWSREVATEKKSCEKKLQPTKKVATRKGGQPNNQNSVGNRGNNRASPPKNNKNASKTGEHESIFADFLTDDEKEFLNQELNLKVILEEEIAMLRIRQRRMMRRLQEAEKGLDQKEIEVLYQLRKIKTPIESEGKKLTITTEKMSEIQRTEKTYRSVSDVLAIEEALTRVSNQLVKATKRYDDIVKTNNSGDDVEINIITGFD